MKRRAAKAEEARARRERIGEGRQIKASEPHAALNSVSSVKRARDLAMDGAYAVASPGGSTDSLWAVDELAHAKLLKRVLDEHRAGHFTFAAEAAEETTDSASSEDEAEGPATTVHDERAACAPSRYLHSLATHRPPALEIPEFLTDEDLGVMYTPKQNDDYSTAAAAAAAHA